MAAFFLVAVGYSVTIPAGEGVDETPHFDYVRYVKEKRALPIQPMTREQGVKVLMGHHPPLYYFLGALVVSWIDTTDFVDVFRPNPHFVWQENDGRNGWNVMLHFGQDEFPWHGSVLALHTMRLVNIVLASIALYAIYQSSRLLFPQYPWVALGATAVIAFNPSFIFMSSTVHHDVLQATIFALAIWWILRFLNRAERPYDAVLAGLLVGSAMLTKISGLALALVIGLVFLIQAFRERAWRPLLRRSVVTYSVAALVAGWWYVRNWLLYGDLLGWQMFLNIHSHMLRSTSYTWNIFKNEFLAQIGRTFWGGFGFMHITFPEITKYFWWLIGLSLVGLLVAVARGRLDLRKRWAEWLVVLALLIVLFISFVRFSMATVGAGHGRYLFPAAFSIGILVISGLNAFTGWRNQRIISIALAIGFLAYAIWLPAKMVLPKYASPITSTDQELAQTIAADLQVAEGLTLVAYELGADRTTPGQEFPVSLYWQARGSPAERQDPKVRIEIVDAQNKALASFTTWPVPSLSPNVWSDEAIYNTRAVITLPSDTLQDRLYLTVAPIYHPIDARDDELPVDHRIRIAEIVTEGTLSTIDPETSPQNRQEVLANQLAFEGYELSPEVVASGDTILVALYWRVIEAPAADYTVFVHLLNEDGELVAQFDRPAGGLSNPTSGWQEGSVLRDVYPLVVPENMPPGFYTLDIGMYTWPTLSGVTVTIGGAPVDDNIELGEVQIIP